MTDVALELVNGGDNAIDVTGVFQIDYANPNADGTLNVTMTLVSATPFYGQLWTATVTSAELDLSTNIMSTNVIFEWGTSNIANESEIYVTMQNEVTFNADGTATFTTLDGASNDGVLGDPMDNGPFTGFTADFSATNMTVAADSVAFDYVIDVPAVSEDTAYVIDVLSNDTDIEGDASITSATALNGTVVINADGTLMTYTGNQDYNGADIITYTLSDGEFDSTATVTFDVAAVNDDPSATDDTTITVDEDTAAAINVLANDSDVEGDTLSVTGATADNGTVVINADNTLTYTGNQDFNGSDTITYTLSDGNGGTDTATVAVDVTAVNDAPVVDTDAIRALMGDVELGGDAVTFNVLDNTTDAEGGSLIITSVSTVNYMGDDGTAVNNGDGTVTFTPAVAGGSQNIIVSVSDGTETTNSTFSVTVVDNIDEAAVAQAAADAAAAAANNAPVANADTATTVEETLVNIDVLANDIDADSDTLFVVDDATLTATNGTVAINANGTLDFTPETGFTGDAVINYTITDGAATSSSTATVTVNAAEAVVASFSMDDQLIQLRNAESITKAQASINEWGADYTGGDISTVLKYELWLDTDALTALNAGSTEIQGWQLDMDVDPNSVQDLDWSVTTGTTFGTSNTDITFNSALGTTAGASATAIVDTNVTNDGPPFFIGGEKLIATFYVNPIDADATSVDITVKDMLVVTNDGNIEQDDYTVPAIEIV